MLTLPSSRDLLAPIRRWQLDQPDKPALLAEGRPAATFDHVIRQVDATVDALLRAGISPGHRVALVLPNAPETALCILAVASHATCIPFNPTHTADELLRLIAAARVDAAIILHSDNDAATSLQAAGVNRVLMMTPTREGVTGEFALRSLGRSPRPPPAATAAAPSLVLHTSGSTGTPKRVPLSVQHLLASAHNVARSLELGEHDVGLSMMPMFHIGALVDLLLAPLSAGGAVCFAREISSAAFFDALARFAPTWFQAVPTLLRDLLAWNLGAEDYERMARLGFIRAVSQPLPPALQEEFETRFRVPLLPMFGMTETAGVITSMPRGDRRPGSVGVPFGAEVRIADHQNNAVRPGELGEVLVAGRTVMDGYEDDGDAGATFSGVWLRTGDLGYVDEDGYLFLTGRSKDQINRGGEKIAPTEIDLITCDLPTILEAAAFAVPHPSLGEDVALAIVARPGTTADVDALAAHLRQRLAPHKVPRHIYVLDRLPRLPSGKLNRRALPELVKAIPAQATRTLPRTRIEREVARIWSQVLGVEEIALEDDFFELGGDSLRATTLSLELEARFGATFAPGALFDTPTLHEMAKILGRVDRQASARVALDPRLHRSLQRITAGWRGMRQPGSLIVGRNTSGSKRPFFWIPQSLHGLDAVATNLDANRPVYSMPTLSLTGAKTEANTRKLAAYLAHEITNIDNEGPYLLGGFCQGAVVAFEVAKALKAMGRTVLLLCLQDRFVPKPYGGAVALLSGKRGFHCSHYVNYVPQNTWRRYYAGPIWFRTLDADHEQVHNPPHAQQFGRQLEELFTLAEAAMAKPAKQVQVQVQPAPSPVPGLIKCRVRAKLPLLLRQGEERRLEIVVTNRGADAWQPYDVSGLVLAARWTVWRSTESLRDSFVPIGESLAPGRSRHFELPIRVPMRGLPLYLELTVVEDGLSHMQERDIPAYRRLVLPLTPEGLIASAGQR
ncbi:non-ribosomal peptide synthetase [Devosia sp. CAU 1758]